MFDFEMPFFMFSPLSRLKIDLCLMWIGYKQSLLSGEK